MQKIIRNGPEKHLNEKNHQKCAASKSSLGKSSLAECKTNGPFPSWPIYAFHFSSPPHTLFLGPPLEKKAIFLHGEMVFFVIGQNKRSTVKGFKSRCSGKGNRLAERLWKKGRCADLWKWKLLAKLIQLLMVCVCVCHRANWKAWPVLLNKWSDWTRSQSDHRQQPTHIKSKKRRKCRKLIQAEILMRTHKKVKDWKRQE